jgi:hypothetical protein
MLFIGRSLCHLPEKDLLQKNAMLSGNFGNAKVAPHCPMLVGRDLVIMPNKLWMGMNHHEAVR